jgi:hypothetical protein
MIADLNVIDAVCIVGLVVVRTPRHRTSSWRRSSRIVVLPRVNAIAVKPNAVIVATAKFGGVGTGNQTVIVSFTLTAGCTEIVLVE